jgi:DNA-binding response OmpR family regulator
MPENILIVDDEQRIIDLAQMYLEQEGYTVDSATDGSAAYHKIMQEQPGLVVLDLMLPGMDGWEICRKVRAESYEPIIL